MGKPELLRELRERTQAISEPYKEFWRAPGLPCGVPKGVIVELLGNAKTEWLVEIFKIYPEPYIFWCQEEERINPTALHQRGVELSRIKFVNFGENLQQPLRLALESQFYPFLVAPNKFQDIKIFQRFHLLAEKSKSTVFFLTEKKFSLAWPISLQLEINSSDSGYQIEVHRQKYGGPA